MIMKYLRGIGIALGLIGLVTLVAHARSPQTRAQQSNRVALVVGFGDGTYATECVRFTEPGISGFETLMRSDLDVVSNGGAVCRIEGMGCPADDCFCAAPDYWSYWHLIDGTWQYSGSGAQGYLVHDGGVEGWHWGSQPPPTLVFDQICPSFTVHIPIVLAGGS